VSATEGLGRRDLLDQVVGRLWPTGDVDVEPVMKLAVVAAGFSPMDLHVWWLPASNNKKGNRDEDRKR